MPNHMPTADITEEDEERALEFVKDFLRPYLEGSQAFEIRYSPGVAEPVVHYGEVAVAAQTLLVWRSSGRLERLTRWLIGTTVTLLGLTAVLAALTWRLAFG